MNRREFIKLLGTASLGLAAAGCTEEPPVERLIPYLVPPEDIIPGVAKWYASVCRECPAGCGISVRTREGRAKKIEGNPSYPINQGSLCARGQAALQGLYNPDRIKGPLKKDDAGKFKEISWEEAEGIFKEKILELYKKGEANKIFLLTNNATGSLDSLIDAFMSALGANKPIVYESIGYEPLRRANLICFGLEKIPLYDIQNANYLLSFGADFLETWLSPVHYAKAFGNMRFPKNGKIVKFIHIEPRLSLTASNADEWIPIKPGKEGFLALGIAHEILEKGLAPELSAEEAQRLKSFLMEYSPEKVSAVTEVSEEIIKTIARDFAQERPSLAIGGGAATTSTNSTSNLVAINLLNYVAGNVGKTVLFGPTMNLSKIASFQSMLSLTETMSQGQVEILMLHNVNPVFTLPPSAKFEDALKKVPFLVSFSSFMDETTELAHLILPDPTPLESWGDYFPQEGVYGIMQPVVNPVFNTKATGDVVLTIAQKIDDRVASQFPWKSFLDYLKDAWKNIKEEKRPSEEDFETFWTKVLQDGGLWEAVPSQSVGLSEELFRVTFEEPKFEGEKDSFHFLAYPSSFHFDGRGANKPFLQELADPVTKIVWDSWMEVHPETAKNLGLTEGDIILVESPYGKIEVPAHLYAGVRPDSLAIPIGQGHKSYGRYAKDRGVNPLEILPSTIEPLSGGLAWAATKVKVSKTGQRVRIVTTEGSKRELGRGIVRAITLEELKGGKGEEIHEEYKELPQEENKKNYKWGMAIDLTRCIGCSACVMACYVENNLPAVGKEQCARGREMTWIRVERYFEGDYPNLKARFVPMLCQHCANAPCEPVCPVYATYHSPEGLNTQIYNRCIGTRYCANNCPYKVRYFNWFTYRWPSPLNWQLNPDVSVREKGVMEKCTFCFQRIRDGKDRAKDEGRRVRDGEIIPACAQTCPTNAIIFGDLNDPESIVSKLSKDGRGYHVFEQLNTRTSITYLKKVIQVKT